MVGCYKKKSGLKRSMVYHRIGIWWGFLKSTKVLYYLFFFITRFWFTTLFITMLFIWRINECFNKVKKVHGYIIERKIMVIYLIIIFYIEITTKKCFSQKSWFKIPRYFWICFRTEVKLYSNWKMENYQKFLEVQNYIKLHLVRFLIIILIIELQGQMKEKKTIVFS